MRRKKAVLHCVLIFSLSIAVYLNHFNNGFVYDDAVTIHRNFDVKHLDKALSNIAHFNSRPLVQISYALNYYFSHLKLPVYHVTNFVFHIGTSFLIYWLLFLLSNKKNFSLPFISALFFSLHPINTESVCYLSSRASIFLAFFYLLSVCFYIQGKMFGFNKKFFLAFLFYIGTLFFFIAGWLSKQNIATLPLMLIVVNYYFFSSGSSIKHFIKENRAFLMFTGIAGFAGTYYAASHLPSVGGDKYSPLVYFASEVNAIPLYYLRLFLFPFNLNIDPDFPLFYSLSIFKNSFSILAIFCLLFFIVQAQKRPANALNRLSRDQIGLPPWKEAQKFTTIKNMKMTFNQPNICDNKRWISFGLVWFFITLLPTSGFIPLNELVSEHRVYLPAVGLAILFSSLLLTVIKKIKSNYLNIKPYGFFPWYTVVLFIVLLFCLNVTNRNFTWRNNEIIWTDALEKSPFKARPFNETGLIYFNRGDFDKAEMLFENAIKLNPKYAHTLVNIGNLYDYRGKREEAVIYYKKAIEQDLPSSYFAHIGIGNIHLKNSDLQSAQDAYQTAISLNPNHPLALYNSGRIHELLNKMAKAKTYYQKAVDVDPDFFLALNNLGAIYINEGLYRDALPLLNRAIEANPNYVEAYGNLGVAYHFLRNADQAKIFYKKALIIDPNYHSARENLKKLLFLTNQP